MTTFTRLDRSVVGSWWWTVDRWTLVAVGLLVAMGGVMVLAASPAIAARLHLDSFHFVRRQFMYLPMAVMAIFAISLLSPLWVRRLAVVSFGFFSILTIATLLVGPEVKGAHRWLQFGSFTLQPTEFLKPSFAVVAAWMFAEQRRSDEIPGNLISIALFVFVVSLLLLQPDVGMTLVVSAVWFAQFFLAGLPIIWVVMFVVVGIVSAAAAYSLFPHVASRVDRFMDPSGGGNYQIERAMEAFQTGGFFGVGPGDGSVKRQLPDAHTDFIFAVLGEEFGVVICLFVVALFAFIVLRGFSRLLEEKNFFVVLAAAGLLIQFGLQAVINIGVNLRLMPTKGMTLPFISYGGSSMFALALLMGMLLALSRRRAGTGELR
ncbi:putative lipid II flippase FtsW [Sneathiella sp. HT1-7]|uniref:putative lipid II flippase FtsW n=1 Tax=Sneathiella sp. HT1-7 TaxID=2887192 RepID=UPI001D13BC3F|nr:putative lipid II flippase FtsW [Sneathiella sp. HT1-7]MCC3306655.1 putative lipid II flippase FtsW [Sneathiella sp. HT1-7]